MRGLRQPLGRDAAHCAGLLEQLLAVRVVRKSRVYEGEERCERGEHNTEPDGSARLHQGALARQAHLRMPQRAADRDRGVQGEAWMLRVPLQREVERLGVEMHLPA